MSRRRRRYAGHGGEFQGALKPRKVKVDGHVFDSQTEAARYGQLCLLERVGQVRNLKVHPKVPMHINGKKLGRGYMVLDFSFEEYKDGAWRTRYEDVKGALDTREAKLRRRVAELVNDITIHVFTP